jgi:hypothetical protein
MAAGWLYALTYFDSVERINLNQVVNARDINGNLISELVEKIYPGKINFEVK